MKYMSKICFLKKDNAIIETYYRLQEHKLYSKIPENIEFFNLPYQVSYV